MPIARLVDPVFVVVAALAVGLWLSRIQGPRRRAARAGRAVAWGAWLALWLLSTPWVSASIVRALSMRPRDLAPELAGSAPEERALVVLSAGMDPDELGVPAMERVSAPGMERCIGAARIYRTYGFRWVIVSGQDPALAPEELAGGMADLIAALGVPREKIVLEAASRDTQENARYSAEIARERGARQVVVVTSALHMPRAVRHFERAGLAVLPAPVRFEAPPPPGLERLIPSSLSLRRSQRAVHELVGRLEP